MNDFEIVDSELVHCFTAIDRGQGTLHLFIYSFRNETERPVCQKNMRPDGMTR